MSDDPRTTTGNKRRVYLSIKPLDKPGNSTSLSADITVRILRHGPDIGSWEVEDEEGRTARHPYLTNAIMAYLTERAIDDKSLLHRLLYDA